MRNVDLGIVTVLSALRQLHLRVTAQAAEVNRIRAERGRSAARAAEAELRKLVEIEQRVIRSMANAVDLHSTKEETT